MSLIDLKPGDEVDALVLDNNFKELNNLIAQESEKTQNNINSLTNGKANINAVPKLTQDGNNVFNSTNTFNGITTFMNNVVFKSPQQGEGEDTTSTFGTRVTFNKKVTVNGETVFKSNVTLTDELYADLCTKNMPDWLNRADRNPDVEYTETKNGYLYIYDTHVSGVYYCISFAQNKELEEGVEAVWVDYLVDTINNSAQSNVVIIPIPKTYKYKLRRVDSKGVVTNTELPKTAFKQLFFIPCIGG